MEVIHGRVRFLVPILLEDLSTDELSRDLQTFLRTHTYIDARKFDLHTLKKRIRLAMPDTPLQLIHQKDSRNGRLDKEEYGSGRKSFRVLQADGTTIKVKYDK